MKPNNIKKINVTQKVNISNIIRASKAPQNFMKNRPEI